MCASCGCHKYEDSHGDQRNITISELRQAAEAAHMDINRVVENLREASSSVGSSSRTSGGGSSSSR